MLYFELIPDDIKYVVLSKIKDIHDFNTVIKILSFNSSINFKYLMSIMYNDFYKQINHVLNINTNHNFTEYNLNGEYYIYPILLQDIILLGPQFKSINIENVSFYLTADVYNSYINNITKTILYMILFNKDYPNIYSIIGDILHNTYFIIDLYTSIRKFKTIDSALISDNNFKQFVVDTNQLIDTGNFIPTFNIDINFIDVDVSIIDDLSIIIIIYIIQHKIFKDKIILSDTTIEYLNILCERDVASISYYPNLIQNLLDN